jgi:hypothetical protein
MKAVLTEAGAVANSRSFNAYELTEFKVFFVCTSSLTYCFVDFHSMKIGCRHSEVHKNGYISCAVDCHNTIRTKMVKCVISCTCGFVFLNYVYNQEERLKKTVSKGFDEVVQYDEDAPRVDSPTKKLRDRFKQMKKMNQHSVD